MKTKYRPHLINANKPFEFNPSKGNEVRSALLLVLFQNFLAIENHSLAPYKSRLEFCGENNQLHPNHQSYVNSVNSHAYGDLFEQSPDNLQECSDAKKFGLRLAYFPQVPCKPFYFPVKDIKEAVEFYNLLVRYDEFLLTECDSMRVDYSNIFELEMIDPQDGDWCSWFLESGDEYFDDFRQYLDHIEENEAA
ncbi:hypothetical protein R7Q39_19040 [Vibrio sp. 947]|uniref:hypothetical protein n=1 Tax=unclassified Vibrio TaxID=2614977 RepID=UPI002963D047|nr:MULTISPECIES: hypothetical protein [unclassified Vibrio]MDW1583813.1 hypothetical protein [Vibrio sp. Vb2897]MDW1642084.1 hypothetical protein [Vibrio sp. Vb2896]MDW1927527.1 hypothetical protein [Vibrio sp. 947]